MNQKIDEIKSFLKEMKTQDNRSTAKPYFYVIRTKVKDQAPVDNCDYTKWYWGDTSWDSLDDLREHCEEMEYSQEEIESALEEANEYGVKERWEDREMFLTETDAERHLKLNHYHYSPDAHTYVKHAWRAPALEKFFTNLMEYFDI